MSLVLHLEMDDPTVAEVRDSAGANHLAAIGYPPIVAGRVGPGARSFGTQPPYVPGTTIPQYAYRRETSGLRAAAMGANMTLAFWVRMDDSYAGVSRQLIRVARNGDPSDLLSVWHQSSGAGYVRITQDWWDSEWQGSDLPFQEWTHYVFRKSGGLLDTWKNGVNVRPSQLYTLEGWSGYGSTGIQLWLAADGVSVTDAQASDPLGQGWGPGVWPGSLDDVRLYDVALTDAQVATLYAGGDPFAPVPSGDVPDPAADLAAHLAGLSPVGDVTLEVGGNLFVGPERAVRAEVPELALFAQNTTGAAPVPYVNDRFDFARFAVSLLVRGNPGQFAAGEQLAREVLRAMHREKPTGYVTCLASQAGPTYLGEDEARRHRWSLNFEMWWKG